MYKFGFCNSCSCSSSSFRLEGAQAPRVASYQGSGFRAAREYDDMVHHTGNSHTALQLQAIRLFALGYFISQWLKFLLGAAPKRCGPRVDRRNKQKDPSKGRNRLLCSLHNACQLSIIFARTTIVGNAFNVQLSTWLPERGGAGLVGTIRSQSTNQLS